MGKHLSDEAYHAPAGLAEEVGMVSRAARSFQFVRAEAPCAVDALNGVHQPSAPQQFERAVKGYPIAGLKARQPGQVRLRDGISLADKAIQDLKAHGRNPYSGPAKRYGGIHGLTILTRGPAFCNTVAE